VLKNELAAGVMPCGRLGANAAWLQFAVMTHNVLTALKRLALPEKWLTARPKRMRFQIFLLARKTGLACAANLAARAASEGTVDGVDRDDADATDPGLRIAVLTDGL
jgi:hypothetical protein